MLPLSTGGTGVCVIWITICLELTAVFAAQDKISQLCIFQGDVLIFAARWGDSEMPGFGVVSSQPYHQSSIQWLSLSRRIAMQ